MEKIVPLNIKELFIPVRLVHWIIGNNSKQNKGLPSKYLYFTIKDVKLLIDVLET